MKKLLNSMYRLKTIDGFEIEIWMYNNFNCDCHVFVANKPGEFVNSANSSTYHLHGRDAFDCLMSDGKTMTREDIVRMFFGN